MAVTHHSGNSFKCRQFFWSALSVTAGNENLRTRIESVCAANISAGFAVGFRCHATGVDDNDMGFLHLAGNQSKTREAGGHGLSIGAGSAAAKVFDMEAGGHLFQCIPATLYTEV
jgi:hypothetical protein